MYDYLKDSLWKKGADSANEGNQDNIITLFENLNTPKNKQHSQITRTDLNQYLELVIDVVDKNFKQFVKLQTDTEILVRTSFGVNNTNLLNIFKLIDCLTNKKDTTPSHEMEQCFFEFLNYGNFELMNLNIEKIKLVLHFLKNFNKADVLGILQFLRDLQLTREYVYIFCRYIWIMTLNLKIEKPNNGDIKLSNSISMLNWYPFFDIIIYEISHFHPELAWAAKDFREMRDSLTLSISKIPFEKIFSNPKVALIDSWTPQLLLRLIKGEAFQDYFGYIQNNEYMNRLRKYKDLDPMASKLSSLFYFSQSFFQLPDSEMSLGLDGTFMQPGSNGAKIVEGFEQGSMKNTKFAAFLVDYNIKAFSKLIAYQEANKHSMEELFTINQQFSTKNIKQKLSQLDQILTPEMHPVLTFYETQGATKLKSWERILTGGKFLWFLKYYVIHIKNDKSGKLEEMRMHYLKVFIAIFEEFISKAVDPKPTDSSKTRDRRETKMLDLDPSSVKNSQSRQTQGNNLLAAALLDATNQIQAQPRQSRIGDLIANPGQSQDLNLKSSGTGKSQLFVRGDKHTATYLSRLNPKKQFIKIMRGLIMLFLDMKFNKNYNAIFTSLVLFVSEEIFYKARGERFTSFVQKFNVESFFELFENIYENKNIFNRNTENILRLSLNILNNFFPKKPDQTGEKSDSMNDLGNKIAAMSIIKVCKGSIIDLEDLLKELQIGNHRISSSMKQILWCEEFIKNNNLRKRTSEHRQVNRRMKKDGNVRFLNEMSSTDQLAFINSLKNRSNIFIEVVPFFDAHLSTDNSHYTKHSIFKLLKRMGFEMSVHRLNEVVSESLEGKRGPGNTGNTTTSYGLSREELKTCLYLVEQRIINKVIEMKKSNLNFFLFNGVISSVITYIFIRVYMSFLKNLWISNSITSAFVSCVPLFGSLPLTKSSRS